MDNYLHANYGWICPKCGKVYAPYAYECCSCNANTKTSTDSITINPCTDRTMPNAHPDTNISTSTGNPEWLKTYLGSTSSSNTAEVKL